MRDYIKTKLAIPLRFRFACLPVGRHEKSVEAITSNDDDLPREW